MDSSLSLTRSMYRMYPRDYFAKNACKSIYILVFELYAEALFFCYCDDRTMERYGFLFYTECVDWNVKSLRIFRSAASVFIEPRSAVCAVSKIQKATRRRRRKTMRNLKKIRGAIFWGREAARDEKSPGLYQLGRSSSRALERVSCLPFLLSVL